MTTLTNQWRELRAPVLGLVVILLVLCFIIYLVNHDKNTQDLSLSNAKNLFNNAQRNLQLAKLEQQSIEQYMPQYQHLLQTGFIGEERRHLWIEQLRQVRAHYQLFNIDYALTQQQTYQPHFIAQVQNHEMYRSVMTLKLALLHEGDLVHLLAGLRENTSPFMVRECEVVRIADAEIKTDGRLMARCEIDWITMKANS